jgi:AcrR family transcriptional regulator
MNNKERREKTIGIILNASLRTLESVGYNRFRTIDVAMRSEMSEGTVFRYFPTKLELVRASFERALQNHTARLINAYSALEAPIGRHSLVSMLWTLLSNEELLWTYELFAAANTDHELRKVIRLVSEEHAAVIEEAMFAASRAMNVPISHMRQLINVVTWAMQGLVLRDMGRGDTASHQRLIAYIVRLTDTMYPHIQTEHHALR